MWKFDLKEKWNAGLFLEIWQPVEKHSALKLCNILKFANSVIRLDGECWQESGNS